MRHHERHVRATGACDCACDCGECDCHCCCECSCDCECHTRFRRRYRTKAEQIAELEKYLADLKAEVQAVEECLAELRK